MAENFIQRGARAFANMVGLAIAANIEPERVEALTKSRQYYEGVQKAPLKTKPGQANDNLITNWIGLAVDRGNSMLLGGGVEFLSSAGDESLEQQYLDAVWEVNKKGIFLHRTGQDGELFGTPFVKIIPDALIDNENKPLPRLVLLDPALMRVETDPMDIDRVTQYVFEIKLSDNHAMMEVTRRADDEAIDLGNGFTEVRQSSSWIVETYENDGRSSGAWKLINSIEWPFEFPPILHWQNLPSIHSVYGVPGIAGALDLQDKHNFVVSNMLKVLRYHAHPKTWGRGFPAGTGFEKTSWGPDELIKLTSESAMISNLEMQSDLASSRNIAQDLRQAIFDLCRVVDIASVTDKVGALTNFGLRVLYSDALSKNATRRQLYGDALQELNRRLLILAGFTEVGSTVEWGSDLPQDEKEDAQLIRDDLLAGLVSHETAAERRGYQWETVEDIEGEADKIAAERAADTDRQVQAAANLLLTGLDTPDDESI
jgi:hypothetical protein